MLKITRLSAPTAPVTRLRVDGRIVLRTAAELAKACQAALAECPPVLVDLGGVVFVDREGAAALDALERRGATIVGCSPFVGALLRAHADGPAESEGADEAALAVRLRADDPDAFGDLVRRYADRAWTVARRLLSHDADARAAVQEAFVAVRDDARSMPDGARLVDRIVRAVTMAALARLRSRIPSGATALDALLPRFRADGHWASAVAPFELPENAEAVRARVRHGIGALPDVHRSVLVLRDVAGLEVDEAAALLAVGVSVARTRLHEARQALRTLLARSSDAEATAERARSDASATVTPS